MTEPLAEDLSSMTSAIPLVSAHRSALRTNERTYFECDSLALSQACATGVQQVVALAHPPRSAGRANAMTEV